MWLVTLYDRGFERELTVLVKSLDELHRLFDFADKEPVEIKLIQATDIIFSIEELTDKLKVL